MIYFAQLPTGGIKIGFSDDVPRRLDQLACHYGCELDLLHTMPGGRSVEAELHERFSHLRFGRTEQFQPAPELMAFIRQPLLVMANPAAVEVVEPKSRLIGFVPDGSLRADIADFRETYPIKISVSAACCYLIRRGLEAVKAEKEAARA